MQREEVEVEQQRAKVETSQNFFFLSRSVEVNLAGHFIHNLKSNEQRKERKGANTIFSRSGTKDKNSFPAVLRRLSSYTKQHKKKILYVPNKILARLEHSNTHIF